MKDMIKKIVIMMVGITLIVLPTAAQTFSNQKTEQPNVVFQSTSVMTGSGSQYSANPMLNDNGTASYNGASYSPAKAPRKATMDDDEITIVTPGEGGSHAPVGDAIIPLLLMVMAYTTIVFLRRKTTNV